MASRRSLPTLPPILDTDENQVADVSIINVEPYETKTGEPVAVKAEPSPRKKPLIKQCSLPVVLEGRTLTALMPTSPASSFRHTTKKKTKYNNKRPSRVKQHVRFFKDHDSLEPFARHVDGSYPSQTRCILCKFRVITTIFFPCQHKCVCNVCIRNFSIGAPNSNRHTWTSCPVCMMEIELMLPHDGREEELYWHWVTTVKPAFKRFFQEQLVAPTSRPTAPPSDSRRPESRSPRQPFAGSSVHIHQEIKGGSVLEQGDSRAQRPSTVCVML